MTTYLTADTHFGHPLMVRENGPNRPFNDVYAMNRALVEAWNQTVNPEDTVWHLGDFSMKLDNREMAEIYFSLNGIKHLIVGNHDVDKKGKLLEGLKRLDWKSVSHAAEIKHDGNRIMLSHYAGWTWNQAHRGAYLAFGHTHGSMLGLPGSVDVGVDAQGMVPISCEEFVRQAEDTIINAKKHVDVNLDRLAGLLDRYEERADVIRKNRRTVASGARAPYVEADEDEDDEPTGGFRR
ncbi:metallophosphoesterase family protein [Mesorhizobium sp. A623]